MSKSPALASVSSFREKTLGDLLVQCTEAQQGKFWQMYRCHGGELKDIPEDKLDWAIQQCERTVAMNKTKAEKG